MKIVLGLPDEIRACLFDLDGVLTPTARVHAAAWQEMFDEFLRARDGAAFRPFDPVADYEEYVDGKARADGTRSFLTSRGITLPEGGPGDPPDRATVEGLSARKDEIFERRVREDGVRPYPGSVRYLEAARDAGLHRVVVSSSANTKQVLDVTGLAPLVEGRIDGVTLRERGIPGKPAPDSFLAGAALLGLDAARAAVFEDALAGVAAGRAGGFGCVVGVNRLDDEHAAGLEEHGATVVVGDLADLL